MCDIVAPTMTRFCVNAWRCNVGTILFRLRISFFYTSLEILQIVWLMVLASPSASVLRWVMPGGEKKHPGITHAFLRYRA